MPSKTLFKWPVFFISGGIICLSLPLVFFAIPGLPVQDSYAQPVATSTVSPALKNITPGLPVRITIPKIKVNATIESVGLTSQGEVGIPKGPVSAAWFNLSPRPGSAGSAIITGHYGVWKNGTPTVFNNLSKLRQGDKIYVKDGKGATITFVVRELRIFNLKSDVTDVFVSGDAKAHLNLITCEGIWNKVSKSYSGRLVVFADKE
jgi:LPXTG-site transpeptidase (sortase) family protein